MKIIDAEPVMRRIRAALEICEEVRTNGRDELEAVLDDLESQPALSTNLAEVGTDCISRQAAIDALHMHLMYRMGTDSNKKRLDEWINNLPPAQPDIIRCRNCKFASGDSRICMKFDHSPIGELDFCSFAERREVTT